MRLFRSENRDRSARSRSFYAAMELLHTLVDFMAAICFLAGSILFFWPAYETPAIWLFVMGSILFATKPTIRLWREIKLARMGRTDELADRDDPY